MPAFGCLLNFNADDSDVTDADLDAAAAEVAAAADVDGNDDDGGGNFDDDDDEVRGKCDDVETELDDDLAGDNLEDGDNDDEEDDREFCDDDDDDDDASCESEVLSPKETVSEKDGKISLFSGAEDATGGDSGSSTISYSLLPALLGEEAWGDVDDDEPNLFSVDETVNGLLSGAG